MLKRKLAVVSVVSVVAVAVVLAAWGGPPNPNLAFLNGLCPSCCPDWGCGTNGAWLGQDPRVRELTRAVSKRTAPASAWARFATPTATRWSSTSITTTCAEWARPRS